VSSSVRREVNGSGSGSGLEEEDEWEEEAIFGGV
jgi:hypothetical protein